ncbi:MAG: dioxygenase family protein [Pseudomarimonas sp.]
MSKFKMTRRASIQAALGALALSTASTWAAAATPKQTEGPFFPKQDQADKDLDMTMIEGHTEHALGEVVDVRGQVVDESGVPVANALVDVWQANHHGRYAHEGDPNPAPLDPHFQGWSQFRTDADGRYHFRTIKPGAYPVAEDWSRPPHIHFKVALRGYHELTTQMYFGGHKLNDVDRLLLAVPEAERESLVVAFRSDPGEKDGVPKGEFKLVLRKV